MEFGGIDASTRRSRARKRLLSGPLGLVSVSAALVAGAVGAGAPWFDTAPPFAVGHQLTLDDSDAVMQPVHTAAGVERLAARPGPVGTANQEVWAYGHAESPDAGETGGHAVFQHHTAAGWTVTGPPVVDQSGTPFEAGPAESMSIAPNGEGWAVLRDPAGLGSWYNDVFVHRVPGVAGGAWQFDRSSSDVLNQVEQSNGAYNVNIAIGNNAAGTYGYAVVSDTVQYQSASMFLHLVDGHWAIDNGQNEGTTSQGQPANSTGQAAGWVDNVAVDPSSGDAWAVGSAFAIQQDACTTRAVSVGPSPSEYQTCLTKAQAVLSQQPGSVIYHHRSNGGWTAVSSSSLQLPTATPNELQYTNGGSAAGVAADGRGGAWIAGVTGSPVPVSGSVQPASASTPYVLHVNAAEQGAGLYCASGCDGTLPLADGDLTELTTAPPSGGDGGDVFLTGPAPSVLFRLQVPPDNSIGSFRQEPVTVGPIGSMAMFSGTEGWTATSAGLALGPLLGHLTRNPEHPQVSRWPTPTSGQFAAVAEDPSGSGTAMAVGPGGIWRLDPSTGLWSAMPLPPGSDMPRSISWPTHTFAVATGGRTILQYDGSAWHRAEVDGSIGGDLYSVAAMASPLAGSGPAPVSTTPPPSQTTTAVSQLVGWGGNSQGELGAGTTANADSPTAVQLSGDVLAVSAGGTQDAGAQQYHTLAVACPCGNIQGRRTGSLYAWGSNRYGQLGSAPSPSPTTHPVLVPGFDTSNPTFVAVAAGGAHSLALDASGNIWAWGADSQGQLGDGSMSASHLPEIVKLPGGAALQATAIAAGDQMSLAIDTSGNVWWWGELSPQGEPPSSQPVQLPGISHATQIAAGPDFGIALAACRASDPCATSGRELFGWGRFANRYVTQCTEAPATNPVAYCPPQPLMFQQDAHGTLLDVTSIAAGAPYFDGKPIPGCPNGHSLGTLAVAGGQLWDVSGTGNGNSVPVSALADPTYRAPACRIPGFSSVTSAAVGNSNFTLVGEQDGSLWGLGSNKLGELAANPQATPQSLDTPLRIGGLVTHGPIAAGWDQALAFADSYTVVQSSGPSGPGGSAPGFVGAPNAQAWAVGAGGTTVRFDGHRWSVDPSPVNNVLDAVTATGHDFVAAGYDGVILVDSGQGWSRAPTPSRLGHFPLGSNQLAYPRLYAASGLPDGTVLIGGEYGTLLRRDPGDAETGFHLVSPSVNGTIHAVGMHRDSGGTLHMLISVGWVGGGEHPKPDQTALDYTGWLMAGDGTTWRDLEFAYVNVFEAYVRARDVSPQQTNGPEPFDEHQVMRDGAQGVVIDPSGRRGWAVGDNGSAWRVSLDGEGPAALASPMASTVGVATDPTAVGSFAYMANMGCVQGTCADMVGWGSRGDVVSLESLRAIDAAARTGSLGLLVSGGDLRRMGDESLNAMPGLFNSLSIPTYAAIGAKDLNPANTGTCTGGTNANAPWRKAFQNMPQPWGSGGVAGSITPVTPTGPSCAGSANTHYAFVWHAPGGSIRFVVLDTSGGANSDADPTNQSPQESEIAWLTGLLPADTQTPTIVVMNKPVLCNPNAAANDTTLSNLLGTANVVGVLASAQPGNWSCNVGSIPVYMFAGGGGAFETSTPMNGAYDPQHGDYFSWQSISVMRDPSGHYSLDVRSHPVLESVALAAPGGTVATRGNAIPFTGLGRIPDMGRITGDEFPYTAYTPTRISFPFDPLPNVLRPDYTFSSDDSSVIAPVQVGAGGLPYKDATGHTWPDPHSGLFCAFKPGTTTIHLTTGTVTAQLPVTVRAGSGTQCGPLAKLPPPPVVVPVKPVVQQPVVPRPLGQAPVGITPHHAIRPNPGQQSIGAVVPPPAEVVPAPPGGGGVGESAGQKEKEEESEAAMEDAKMSALDPGRGSGAGWLPLGAAVMGTGLAAYALAIGRRRRGRPSRAAVVALGAWDNRRRR